MKKSIIILFVLLTAHAFGQRATNKLGYNKNIPTRNSIGMKFSYNLNIPSLKLDEKGADLSFIKDVRGLAFGAGFFWRTEFTAKSSLQTEIIGAYRSGAISHDRTYNIDTMLNIQKLEISNYSAINIEIPIYYKHRFEFIPNGRLKTQTALGVLVGPRAMLAVTSERDLSRASVTTLYDQRSEFVNNDITGPGIDLEFSPLFSLGMSAGADIEFTNGLMFHVIYTRGLMSHSIKEHGYKLFDNRIELGLAFRLK